MAAGTGAVHIVEPGGRGGVHHHVMAASATLARAGTPVTVHTARDAELAPDGVALCRCVDWHRAGRGPLRRARVLYSYLAATIPHLRRTLGPEDVLHFEGLFKPTLTALTIAAGHRARTRVLSPHNTFSRGGSRREERVIDWLLRKADTVIVFSAFDAQRARDRGARRVVRSMLATAVPEFDPARVQVWRERWGAAPVVLFAGQLREDKRLDLAIDAVAASQARTLAVVGQDMGALPAARTQASARGVSMVVDEGYLPYPDFVAAFVAADAVICPYEIGSQSAILSLARALDRPSVATAVGGLSELATVAVPVADPEALARGIDEALTVTAPVAHGPDVVETYREAYGLGAR